MRINHDCTGCGLCPPYCPVGAILAAGDVYRVDEDQCVECGVCQRTAGCPVEAFVDTPGVTEWPRSLRSEFSNPMRPHPTTQGLGRGTEEMKCNDVTARFRRGEVGVAMEFGRPGIATRLGELEKMTLALAPLGVEYEKRNPTYFLMADAASGRFKDDARHERVLSAILEFKVSPEKLPEVLAVAKRVAKEIDTVFSLDVISRIDDDGGIPVLPAIKQSGFTARLNAKINLGMGRPLIA